MSPETEITPPTDTPKYVGSIAYADEFYRPEYITIDRASDSFPVLERIMMEEFAARKNAHDREESTPYEAISEIYVRAREVQKLVLAARKIGPAWLSIAEDNPNGCGQAVRNVSTIIDELTEALAALSDIK